MRVRHDARYARVSMEKGLERRIAGILVCRILSFKGRVKENMIISRKKEKYYCPEHRLYISSDLWRPETITYCYPLVLRKHLTKFLNNASYKTNV